MMAHSHLTTVGLFIGIPKLHLLIFLVIRSKGRQKFYIDTKEISAIFDIKHPTISKYLSKLKKIFLFETERIYRGNRSEINNDEDKGETCVIFSSPLDELFTYCDNYINSIKPFMVEDWMSNVNMKRSKTIITLWESSNLGN